MLGAIVRTLRLRLLAALAGVAIGGMALAQDAPSIVVPPAVQAVPAPAVPGPEIAAVAVPAPDVAAPATQPSAARLEQLVAPVALYPDPLLAQILMASTYPLEVVEAARWIADPANRALSGDGMVRALAAQNWDASVKALAAFPDVLRMMNDRLQWTEDLGNAFLAQQAGIMDAVQRLRRQAMAAGNLKTTPQCDCAVQSNGDAVAISPAEPEEVRVPVYSPAAYGSWPDPDYPPDVFQQPDASACPPGYWLLCYGEPVDLAFFGPLWGWSSIAWPPRAIVVRRQQPIRRDDERAERVWVHDPAHRGDVRYPDAATRARFERARMAAITTGARADMTADTAAAPSADAGRLTALRREAAREWEGRAESVTVVRGVVPTSARPAAVAERGSPTIRRTALSLPRGPANRAGRVGFRANSAPRPVLSGPHSGAPEGRLR